MRPLYLALIALYIFGNNVHTVVSVGTPIVVNTWPWTQAAASGMRSLVNNQRLHVIVVTRVGQTLDFLSYTILANM